MKTKKQIRAKENIINITGMDKEIDRDGYIWAQITDNNNIIISKNKKNWEHVWQGTYYWNRLNHLI